MTATVAGVAVTAAATAVTAAATAVTVPPLMVAAMTAAVTLSRLPERCRHAESRTLTHPGTSATLVPCAWQRYSVSVALCRIFRTERYMRVWPGRAGQPGGAGPGHGSARAPSPPGGGLGLGVVVAQDPLPVTEHLLVQRDGPAQVAPGPLS